MKHIKAFQKHQPQRQSIAIQSEPAPDTQAQAHHNNQHKNSIANASFKSDLSFMESPRKLVEKLTRAELEYQEEQRNKKVVVGHRMRGAQINMMKLKDKKCGLNKNIYNISIGELTNHQAYLSSLQEQIQALKEQLQKSQEQQRVAEEERSSQGPSKTIISRKSMCGKIYKRSQSNNSERHENNGLKHKKYSSSFYKWNPLIDDGEEKNGSLSSRYKGTMKNPQENGKRPASQYRVKQKTTKPIQKQKVKEPEINHQQVELNKIVFVRNKEQWQIKGIQDDFRQKLINKLQIPVNFPIEAPDITGTLDQYKLQANNVYKIFGIDIQKCRDKLVVRKFKNGVYYQLKPNKNILWYFSGAFYIGQWDTDLPAESQKNGFGFEYIPNKYIYLGQYKNGMKNGNGSIKIFNKSNANENEFTAYDGSWLDGKPHSFGVQIDEKNNKYIGGFQNGQKSGKCKIINRQGLYYQGQIKKGIKNGRGLQKLVNGDEYRGQFFQGKFDGQGIYKWKNGSMYEGEFSKGKRDGKGKWISYNGDQFEGEYLQDMKHGFGRFKWMNGEIYQGEFRHDIRHGEGTYRHPNGKMGKFMWKEGQIDYRLYSKEEQQYRTRNQREKDEQLSNEAD